MELSRPIVLRDIFIRGLPKASLPVKGYSAKGCWVCVKSGFSMLLERTSIEFNMCMDKQSWLW